MRDRWAVARLSGALTGVAVVAVILTFKFGDIFGYLSIVCSAFAFAAILSAHAQLRRQQQAAQPEGEGLEEEEVKEDEHALDVLDVPEPEPARKPARPLRASPRDEDFFPIEDYDWLTAAQIFSVLPLLDAAELEEVRAREEDGAARATVLRRIDQRLSALKRRAGR